MDVFVVTNRIASGVQKLTFEEKTIDEIEDDKKSELPRVGLHLIEDFPPGISQVPVPQPIVDPLLHHRHFLLLEHFAPMTIDVLHAGCGGVDYSCSFLFLAGE